MKALYTLFLFLLISSPVAVLAQDDTLTSTPDTIYESSSEQYSKDAECYKYGRKPMLEFFYGLPTASIFKSNYKFAENGYVEVRLGYAKVSSPHTGIVKLSQQYFILSHSSAKLRTEEACKAKIGFDVWRAGYGFISSSGYKIGCVMAIPYNANSFEVSEIILRNTPVYYFEPEKELLGDYNKKLRLGTSTEGGLKLQIGSMLVLNGGYERTIVFPKYFFWKNMGSMLIEYAGYGGIEMFVKSIKDSSPIAGPIVDFLLRSGYSYGLYSLRKDKMNWPYDGESPLAFNTWKFGLTLRF